MKRFMYLSIGLFCIALSVALGFHLGSKTALAGGLVSDTNGIVYMASEALGVIDENGQLWVFGNNQETIECWIPFDYPCPPPLPVPMSEVKFFHRELSGKRALLITKDNFAWIPNQDCSEWVNCGQWPGSTVPIERSSWGAIKSTLDEND